MVVIIIAFFLKANGWHDTEFMSVKNAMLLSGIIHIVIILISLLVSIYFRQIALEKKILIMLGALAISLGTIGLADLVFEYNLTFFDILYKSIQFFVGEFEYTALFNKPVPLLVNIARFIALFVTFGTIFTLVLKQKILLLNVKLFYRDVVIITNEPKGYISDFANKFVRTNKKVIIAYTSNNELPNKIVSRGIAIIPIDINKNIKMDLNTCNVKNAKNIYLLCDSTEDNIKLIKAIYSLFENTKQKKTVTNAKAEKERSIKSIDKLVEEYRGFKSRNCYHEDKENKKRKSSKTVCYIQYQTDSERDYYSLDEVFTNRIDKLITYFINVYDISIRQMISESLITDTLNIENETLGALKDELNAIKIAVSGSGEMLNRTISEIAKNCVYNDKVPIEIYYIKDERSNFDISKIKLSAQLEELVKIRTVSVKDLSKLTNRINLFFISTIDEMEAKNILSAVFAHDLQNNIHKYIILTEGNIVKYEILKSYIKGLISPYVSGLKKFKGSSFEPKIYLSNIKDLILAIDKFYLRYGPTGKEIFSAYMSAMINNELQDFNNLPERFINSNILSAMHNNFIMSVVEKMMLKGDMPGSTGSEDAHAKLKELFVYLAKTEHERWYNERRMQGLIYSKEQSHLYNKNANLLHYDDLSRKQQENNIRYVLSTIIAQRRKCKDDDMSDIYKDLIIKYKFK